MQINYEGSKPYNRLKLVLIGRLKLVKSANLEKSIKSKNFWSEINKFGTIAKLSKIKHFGQIGQSDKIS